MKFLHQILVSLRALFDAITTFYEPREDQPRILVARMHDAFESGDLSGLKWIKGSRNLANVLTSPSSVLSAGQKNPSGDILEESIECVGY